MGKLRTGLVALVLRFFKGLRWPVVFVVTALVFVVDLAVPDVLPFVDEILLGLLTLLVGSFRRRRQTKTAEGQENRAEDG